MNWRLSWRADPAARRIADGHYSRQTPGADQFVPPGRCVVLVIPEVAYWVTSWPFGEYVKHEWPGAWVCSAFRNEQPSVHRSSDLVTQALACTRFYWEPPPQGMISFVDTEQTRRKRDPGRCFRKAGFHVAGRKPCEVVYGDEVLVMYRPMCICDGTSEATQGGLVALHLSACDFPPAAMPRGGQPSLGAW